MAGPSRGDSGGAVESVDDSDVGQVAADSEDDDDTATDDGPWDGTRVCAALAPSPSPWALDVDRDGVVTLRLDGDVDPSSLDARALVVMGERSGFINGTVRWLAESDTLEFAPARRADAGERVTATLTRSARCIDGALPGPFSWTWTAAVGGGSGAFSGAGSTTTGAYSYFVIARDLDGDGLPELLTADAMDGTVSILRGVPGAYAVDQVVGGMGYPRYLDAADLDADGDLDVLVATSGRLLMVLENDGAGHLDATREVVIPGNAIAVRTADLDGDGDVDAALASEWAAGLTVLLNDGTGTLTSTGDQGAEPYVLDLGDLDGDGAIDAVLGVYDRNVRTMRNNGAGSFSLATDLRLPDESVRSVLVNDLDGDGNTDAAVAVLYGDQLRVYAGDGAAGLSELSITGLDELHELCQGDLDGDGDIDVAVARFLEGRASVLINDGLGVFTLGADVAVPGLPAAIACADLDGDDDLDLAVAGADPNGASEISVLLNGE